MLVLEENIINIKNISYVSRKIEVTPHITNYYLNIHFDRGNNLQLTTNKEIIYLEWISLIKKGMLENEKI